MFSEGFGTDFLGGIFVESLAAYEQMVESAEVIIEKYNQSKEDEQHDS